MTTRVTTPPSWILAAVGRLRAGLGYLHRSTVPANVALLELGTGAWATQALYVAVELRIADALASGPLHADEVARRVSADPGATYRLMRALASRGVFRLRRDGRFALAPMGRVLRWDHAESMAPLLAMIGRREHWEHWSDLLHSVTTGQTAVEKQRGTTIFEYLNENPDYAAAFHDAMTGASALAIDTGVPAYDFRGHRRIVDVGGGHGALLAAVLAAAPSARGVLFDLPSVVQGGEATFTAAGVGDRVETVGGSFFEAVPAGGDCYLLKTVIHDWDDEKSVAILRNVRAAIVPHGRLLLLEMVLPPGAPPHPGMLLDLEMLVHAGGRERRADEYAKLLSAAGFRLSRVLTTAGPLSIVEAVPG